MLYKDGQRPLIVMYVIFALPFTHIEVQLLRLKDWFIEFRNVLSTYHVLGKTLQTFNF